MKRARVLGVVATMALSAAACAAPSDDGAGSTEAAASTLQSYWADARKLDLGDLTRVSVGFATDQLNDQLAGTNASARFDRPAVFAARAEPSRVLPDGSEIKALDGIVSGLAARFGESELGTRVNRARLDHLAAGRDRYFVESGFTLRAGIAHSWGFDASGLMNGAGVSLGFEANAELSSRVIVAAKDDDLPGVLSAPLSAVKTMRGFIYPRSVDDVRKMKPGEMFALRGQGKLAGNFGVGAPLLVAEPTAGLTYRVVVSAGVSGVIGGQLDVQLVRLPGDELIVDVGVENGRGISFNAAIRDGWGVKAVCDDGIPCLRPLELAGQRVDLQRMVERAIEKRLNSYLTFKIEGGASHASSRVSLSRFKFDLSRGNAEETKRALEQLLKFDLRLAQALYNRDLGEARPAVVNELDAVRASTTSTRNFGFEVLGMNVYQHAVAEKEGSFVVQTPDGARAILFESLEKNGGWFQTRHGYKRTGIAAQTLDARDPQKFKSEANLFLSLGAGDEHIDDDMMLDTLDATLGALGGKELVETLDRFGNQMERLVAARCPVQTESTGGAEGGQNSARWDEACNIRLLDAPDMKALKEQGMQAAEGAISRMPDDYKSVARAAASTRLTLQSVKIHAMDHANGPKMGFRLDARLDDRALAAITSASKADYRSALREYLAATSAERVAVGQQIDKNAVRASVDERWGAQMDRMATRFEQRAAAYKRIADAEAQLPRTLSGKRFVSYPIGIRFEVQRDEAASLENVVATSTSHDRALAAMALFDDLKDEAEGLSFAPLWSEHAAAFPLLAVVPKKNLEVALDLVAEPERNGMLVPLNGGGERFVKAGLRAANAAAKGAAVSTIGGGLFDIAGILNSN